MRASPLAARQVKFYAWWWEVDAQRDALHGRLSASSAGSGAGAASPGSGYVVLPSQARQAPYPSPLHGSCRPPGAPGALPMQRPWGAVEARRLAAVPGQ